MYFYENLEIVIDEDKASLEDECMKTKLKLWIEKAHDFIMG